MLKRWNFLKTGFYEGINLSTISGDVSNIRGFNNGITGNVSNISGDISGLIGPIPSVVRGDVSGLISMIPSGVRGDLTGVFGQFGTQVGPEAGDVIRGNLSNVSGDITGIWGDASDISGIMLNLSGNITPLEGDVSGIEGSVNQIRGDVSNIRGDVSLASGNMTGITGNITGLGGDFTRFIGPVPSLRVGDRWVRLPGGRQLVVKYDRDYPDLDEYIWIERFSGSRVISSPAPEDPPPPRPPGDQPDAEEEEDQERRSAEDEEDQSRPSAEDEEDQSRRSSEDEEDQSRQPSEGEEDQDPVGGLQPEDIPNNFSDLDDDELRDSLNRLFDSEREIFQVGEEILAAAVEALLDRDGLNLVDPSGLSSAIAGLSADTLSRILSDAANAAIALETVGADLFQSPGMNFDAIAGGDTTFDKIADLVETILVDGEEIKASLLADGKRLRAEVELRLRRLLPRPGVRSPDSLPVSAVRG